MSKWRSISIGDFVEFNPSEKIVKGKLAKKIPMSMLTEFEKKIKGFEITEYRAGPKFKNGDTLVAKITPCLENGKTAQVDILDDNEVAFGSSEFIVLRENENSVNDYIYYLAKCPVFRERAISCMEGTSGRKRVNEGALKRQKIIVPDKSTQQKIALFLSALDDKIELNNRIISELEIMSKTIYDYWFVQFDFPDANGKPYKSSGGKMVYNEVLKREVPEGWEVQTLENMGDFKNGINYDPKEQGDTLARIINVRNISASTIFIDTEDLDEIVLKSHYVKKYLVDERSILIARSGIPGAIRLIYDYKENTIYCGFIICFTINNLSLKNIMFYSLKRIEASTTAQSVGTIMLNVNQDTLKRISILLPKDSKLIKSFNELINPVFKQINSLTKQNQQLSQLRDWLLPMLMNGQVSIADANNLATQELGMVAENAAVYGKKSEL